MSKLTTRSVDVSTLSPNIDNARIHTNDQINKVVASIEEFGYTAPILVDENFTVIAGHCRLEAIKRLEIKKISVIVLKGLSDIQKQAYMLADNRLAEDATWDAEKLQGQIELIQEDDDIDFGVVGFTIEDLSGLEEELLMSLSDGVDEDALEEGYNPNLSPNVDNSPVTDKQVEAADEKLKGKFTDEVVETVEVTCPYCEKDFDVKL